MTDQILELESEKQHLSEAVASLQERAQSNSEARVREVETENRLLHQSITDTSSRLNSLETQLKVVSEESERLRELAGRCEEAEREVSRLERSREALNREVIPETSPSVPTRGCLLSFSLVSLLRSSLFVRAASTRRLWRSR